MAVESVKLIQNFDPVTKHNSKTWPDFHGPTQKNNWVKVAWPEGGKDGRATGVTKLLAAQLVKLSREYEFLANFVKRWSLLNLVRPKGVP